MPEAYLLQVAMGMQSIPDRHKQRPPWGVFTQKGFRHAGRTRIEEGHVFDTVVFIDNGSSGSIGMVTSGRSGFVLTPIRKMQDYTKRKKTISRLNVKLFEALIAGWAPDPDRTMVYLERPLINSTMFNTSIVAARLFEAQLVTLESMGYPYQIVDSKDWQRGVLPSSGKKGTTSSILKKESMDIGTRLFPMHAQLIGKHKDADGILGAYSLAQKNHGGIV